MPVHHPEDVHLLDYADGAASPSLELLIATHLSLCPACREQVSMLEAVGGSLLEATAPAGGEDGDGLDRLLARLDGPPPPPPRPARRLSGPPGAALPQPLADHLAGLGGITWRRVTDGLSWMELPGGADGEKLKLLRVAAGAPMPRHTHLGSELTLVLTGAFRDGDQVFRRGDLCLADTDTDHSPVAEPGEDCICLAYTDAPLRLTGPIGRLLNLFLRY